MTLRASSPYRFFVLALLFEASLGVAAFVLGCFVGSAPLATVQRQLSSTQETVQSLLVGAAATLPLLAALIALDRYPLGPIRSLQTLVDSHLVPLFAPLSTTQLLLLSLTAGLGEEMLFRGWLQAGLTSWFSPRLGPLIGLSVASAAFGACHWLTTSYAVLATLVGLYLGLLFLLADNLLAPTVTHAAYDFLALVYLVRTRAARCQTTPAVRDEAQE